MGLRLRAAFVDHSFHIKTRSNSFLKELLSKTFELTEFNDESWDQGPGVDIELLQEFEYVFYWQFIHDVEDLGRLRGKKIVWFPMWDAASGMRTSEWLRYLAHPLRVVCFSKILYDKLDALGFDCVHVRYFIDPESVTPVTDYRTKRVYFWNRVEELNWDVVKRILGNTEIDSFNFVAVPDPHHDPVTPSGKDRKLFNMNIINEYLDHEEYVELVSRSNIYFAPRRFEGIGLSFLEALTRGQCVIAPNNPTMNEYIIHGENGYLYDLDKVTELNLCDFEEIGREAGARAIRRYEEWKRQERELLRYVTEPSNMEPISITALQLRRLYHRTREKLGDIRNLFFLLVSKISRTRE